MAVGTALRVLSNLAGVFISGAAIDVVGVYDSNFKQVFVNARPLKAVIKEDSKPMEHPVETGAEITDHVITLPNEIELSLFINSENVRNTYQEIKQLWQKKTLLTVQTRTGSYSNLFLVSIPHEEDPEMYDAIIIAMKLKEVLFVTPQFGVVPRNTNNATSVNRGTIQPQPATAQQTQRVTFAKSLFPGK